MAATGRSFAVAIVGSGVVGSRVRRQLSLTEHRVVPRPSEADVVVLAGAAPHSRLAAELIEGGHHTLSTTGTVDDIRQLLDLDSLAEGAGVSLVVGAAVSPGLSGILARLLSGRMAACDELHVAVHGTAGPSCAREHHRSLSGRGAGWHDGRWNEFAGGSGRELHWFPEPVGGRDCYRAEMADPILLQRAFPDVDRISARTSATRRDRLTARLPMLSPPHREGGIGALRVEARGSDHRGGRATEIFGIAELLGTATAAVVVAMIEHLAVRPTHGGVVTTVDSDVDARQLARTVVAHGVRLQAFNGVPE